MDDISTRRMRVADTPCCDAGGRSRSVARIDNASTTEA
ncbi:hypothetical protein RR49_01235 [Microbacterium ginsengisoli]|uniref:Uncharacterized protein n=1 Tax=Microbacterium ginsengisoli TaxID=400772 RepID=A0A0F0LUZ1_9MICO|nr:hypothetical protein RR49_01235 [Microbacterium ginsengisoli]